MKSGMSAAEVRSRTYGEFGVPEINLNALQADVEKYGYFGYINKDLRDKIFDCSHGLLPIFEKCIRLDVRKAYRIVRTQLKQLKIKELEENEGNVQS